MAPGKIYNAQEKRNWQKRYCSWTKYVLTLWSQGNFKYLRAGVCACVEILTCCILAKDG